MKMNTTRVLTTTATFLAASFAFETFKPNPALASNDKDPNTVEPSKSAFTVAAPQTEITDLQQEGTIQAEKLQKAFDLIRFARNLYKSNQVDGGNGLRQAAQFGVQALINASNYLSRVTEDFTSIYPDHNQGLPEICLLDPFYGANAGNAVTVSGRIAESAVGQHLPDVVNRTLSELDGGKETFQGLSKNFSGIKWRNKALPTVEWTVTGRPNDSSDVRASATITLANDLGERLGYLKKSYAKVGTDTSDDRFEQLESSTQVIVQGLAQVAMIQQGWASARVRETQGAANDPTPKKP